MEEGKGEPESASKQQLLRRMSAWLRHLFSRANRLTRSIPMF
jgi:hypothetical protein